MCVLKNSSHVAVKSEIKIIHSNTENYIGLYVIVSFHMELENWIDVMYTHINMINEFGTQKQCSYVWVIDVPKYEFTCFNCEK